MEGLKQGNMKHIMYRQAQLESLRTHFFNYHKRANETRLELMIPFQIDVTRAQQNRITNSEVHSMMVVVVPLGIILLHMPKGYLCLFHLLDYIVLKGTMACSLRPTVCYLLGNAPPNV